MSSPETRTFALGGAAFPDDEEVARHFESRGCHVTLLDASRALERHYDDAKRSLSRRGLVLYRRSDERGLTATLERPDGSAGLSQDADEDGWPPAILRRLRDVTEPETLQPRLELGLTRRRFRLERGEGLAEVAFVSVAANYPGSSQQVQFGEVELRPAAPNPESGLEALLHDLLELTPDPAPRLARVEALLALGAGFQGG